MMTIQPETVGASTGSGDAAALGAADWLCLAAAPTFVVMAVMTGIFGGGASDMLCSAAQGASPLSGMVPMYLLMSAFHSPPWLKLVANRRSGARHPDRALARSSGDEPSSPVRQVRGNTPQCAL